MMSNTMFVATAYAVTWAVLLGYLLHLRRTSRRARSAFDRTRRTR